MQPLALQNHRSTDLLKLAAFCQQYLQHYPDAKLNAAEFYTYHPALEAGENVFSVLDADQNLLGFAPLFPAISEESQDIWTVLLALPEHAAAGTVHEMLYQAVLERAKAIQIAYSLSGVRLAADLMVSQTGDIEFLRQKGFEPFEEMIVMSRAVNEAIPQVAVPENIRISRTKMETEDEQTIYLKVYNSCFPANPKTVDDLKFFLESEMWQTGTAITAATTSGQLVGSILVYPLGNACGITDDVMVLPEWRGRNIARSLIGEGLRFFCAQGIGEARLEVRATNAPAVAVYGSMGYREINREVLMGKRI